LLRLAPALQPLVQLFSAHEAPAAFGARFIARFVSSLHCFLLRA
jgi:hypothetical protein